MGGGLGDGGGGLGGAGGGDGATGPMATTLLKILGFGLALTMYHCRLVLDAEAPHSPFQL